MQCESCGACEANVHLTHVVDGVSREAHLCEECASKNGININGAMSLTDILVGLGAMEEAGDERGAKVCSFCGLKSAEFRKGSRLGCAACYDVFGQELKTIVSDMQKGPKHVGKAPGKTAAGGAKDKRLADLERDLEAAIAEEAFEKAAKLRDAIKAMEQ